MAEILTQEWREEHAQFGDGALEVAKRNAGAGLIDHALTWATIAQAHYAAANVRAKPVTRVSADAYSQFAGF